MAADDTDADQRQRELRVVAIEAAIAFLESSTKAVSVLSPTTSDLILTADAIYRYISERALLGAPASKPK